MKKYLIYLFALASTLLIGCDSFRDMSGAAEVNPITVDVYLDITVENISTLKDLTVKFDNYDEDLHYVKEVTDNSESRRDYPRNLFSNSIRYSY